MKVLVEDNDDQFFMRGIQLIINVFCKPISNNSNHDYSTEFSKDNIQSADIIILTCPPGAVFLCHPLLKYRKNNSILFIITTVKAELCNFFLPSCLKHGYLIDKTITTSKFASLLLDAMSSPYRNNVTTCVGCKKKNLTPAQNTIGEAMFYGKSIQVISKVHNISRKTAYAHKNAIKHKFSLNSNHELYLFLSYIYENSLGPEMLLSRHLLTHNQNLSNN